MLDRFRELLFPLAILMIVGTVYCMAMAESNEAVVQRNMRSLNPADANHVADRFQPYRAGQTDAPELID